MKLSRNFVSDYINLPNKTITEIADDMTNVGNEYDSASKLVNATNLVIGKVVECYPHPDADRLRVTKVDIGTEVLDIVCGAPNCREGIKVIVAMVGAKLPEITIKASVIRGKNSNGMLCSLVELGIDPKYLGEDAGSGIHELPEDAPIGESPVKYLNLDDEVIDFELTSNRGDLLSILGMAYELGAIYGEKVKDIDLSYNSEGNINFELDVQTEDCPLFLVKKATNLEVKESPLFIKNRLIASGIRPINNVVDISNYVMIETGQPLHFYDADNLGNKIVVRNANENELVTTLDGKERNLIIEDIVIANSEIAVGLAGVMGGLSTEVQNATKNIIIEAAIFNSIKIRKTAKRVLRSEASNRFEKGLDYNKTYMAIERCCHLLEKYANAKIVSGLVSHDKVVKDEKKITVSYEKINKVLGLGISKNEIIDILNKLSFEVIDTDNEVTIIVPSRRPDLNIKEDIIEEIGRIYGVDNIEGKLPVLAANVGKYNKTKREIRNKMISFGLNETVSYTLIPESEVKKYTKEDFTHVKLADPMSEDRNTLRYSLIPSLKDIYEYNKARSFKDISIFEIGKSFFKDDTYKEELKLACLMSGEYILGLNKEKVDFYIIKGIVEELLNYLGYKDRYSFVVDENIPSELHPKQSASIVLQGNVVGVIGKVHPKESKDDLYVFELNLEKLLINKASKMNFKEISKYPSSNKDMAFIVNKDIEAGKVLDVIKKTGGKILTNVEIFDVYVGENIESDEKSVAFTLTFSDPTKTLSEEEIMNAFNLIIKEVETRCNAKLRDK